MSNQNQESPISIEKAATLLKVSAKTLRRWEKKGILNPARTSGGHRRYLLTQVNDFKKNKGRGRLTQRVIKEKIQQFDTKLTPPVSVYRQNIIAADESGIQTPQSTYLENIIRDFDTPPATDHSPYRLYIIGFISLVVITLSLGVLGIKLSPDDKFSNLLSQVAVKIPFILSQQSDEPSVSNMPQKVLPKDFIGAVLAATSYANLDFKVNVPAIFAETIGANGGDITTTQTTFNLINTTATTLNVGGAATTVSLGGTSGVTSVNNTLNLTNNILTSAGDLTIDPTGGGVKIGTGIQNSVDLTGDDLFITGDLEVDGTSYIPTLSINGDAFTDLTGTGLQISSGALTATLGTSIDSSEISNDEIKEEDLKVSNSPSNTQLLTYNSSSGGFTWIDQSSATGGWTDGGTGIYVTTTTDSVTIGGTTELAKLGIDGDTNEIQLLVQGYSTQTANLVVFENSSGTDLFTFTNSGRLNFVDGGFLDLSAIVHDDSALQGLRLPQAASFTNLTSGEGVIAWDTDDDTLQVFNGTTWANVGGAFTLTADSGTNQTLSPGDTITLAGGTNGIDSVVGATDIVTFNLDTTEVGTTTWNAGATDPTWTFNTSGATDPTLAFANSSLTIGSAATIATDQTSLTLFDTTATTINFASAATTALNVGNGTGNYTAINIGSGIGTHVINIAGTGATAADTVNIGTGGTGADTINLGSSASTTALNLTSGTGSQTFASSVATGTTTTSAFVFTDNSLTTGTGGYVNSSSITQGNLFQIATATGADTLTSGNLLRVSSDLANSTFTGNLASIDWSPDGSTEIFNTSADLLEINAGQYANVGYLLNITDNGSAVFNVSQSAITSALPHSFTAAGDVSMAYDLLFTNQTASYLKSKAPLYLQAGEAFESNNLAVQTYGTGTFLIDKGSYTADMAATDSLATINFATPVDTTGTQSHQGLFIDPTIGNATGGTNTVNFIATDAVTGDAQVTLNAINIGALTGTAATETAVNIGSGWDTDIVFADSAVVLDGPTSSTLTLQDFVTLTATSVTAFNCTDCIDWDDISDAMTLDAATTIASTLATTSLDLNASPAGTAASPIGLEITPTWGIDVTDQTLIGLNINPNTNSNTDSGDTLYTVQLADITATAGTETAIRIGAAYDNLFEIEGTAGDGFQTFIVATAPSADRIYTLPDTTDGTFCLSSGNCAGGAGGSKWTDSGTITYLTSTTDDLAVGGTDATSEFFIDITNGGNIAIKSTGDTENIFDIDANSLTTGSGIDVSSTATAFNGELLVLNKTGASGSTSFTSDIANITYSQTFNTTGTSNSGNVLDISRSITIDDGTAGAISGTVSGTGVTISDTCTAGTADTCTWTADTLRLAQNFTGANSSVLNITTASTSSGSDNFALRVNDDGTFTDSTPFVVDEAGQVGIGTTAPSAKLTIAAGTTSTAPLALTSGNLLSTQTAGAIEFNNDDYYATITTGSGSSYASVYPPAHSDTYVKATSYYNSNYAPYLATDPAKSLIGTDVGTSWAATGGVNTNQRFHIDLGSAKTITRLYYEGWHSNGGTTNAGVKNFTFWGSNDATAFSTLTYATDTNWTQITTASTQFAQHVASDVADPQYITATNSTAYRYYALKFADNWGYVTMGIRRIELQEILTSPRKGIILNNGANLTSGRVPYSTTNGRLIDNSNFVFDGANLGIGTTSPTGKLDIVGSQNFTAFTAPGALTAGTPTAGGSCTAGTHSYKVTFSSVGAGETTAGTVSNVITCVLTTGQTVPLSAIPTGPAGTTGRKIYRTVAGDTGSYLLLTTIADNTTTIFSDTIADASLGAAAPVSNTTAVANIQTGGTTRMVIDSTGNVGIGDTSPAAALTVGSGDLFQVNSSGIIAAIDGVAHTIDDISGNLTLTSNSTSVMVADDLGVNGATSADITSTTTTATVFDSTVTSLSLGGAATTLLDIGNGSGNYTAINIGSGIGTHVINIAGTGATAADTVNIGTGGTGADTINLGSSASTTALNLTSGTGAQTFASSVATGTTTTSAFVFTDNSLTTGTGGYVNSSSITQGNLFQIATATGADTLTSGNLLRISSDLANSTFTGNLAYIDWSPDGTTEIFNSSADLLHINAGQYANVGYLLNITDNGSAVFNVSQTAITSALPHSFTAAGDVSIAYDLLFTNQTASYIKSNAPLTIEAGESFESNNLTLKVYNAGGVVIDGSTSTNTSTGGVMDLNVSSTTTSNVGLNVDYTSASGVTAAADLFAAKINLVQNDTDGDLFGLWIDNNAVTTTIAGTNLVDCLLCLNNSENQAAAVLNAIYIASSGATAGSITNGINIATTDVTTDIILQNGETIDNNTDGTIALASSATSGNITTIGAISALTVAGSATPLRGTSIDLATNYTTADDDTTGLLITLDATTDSDATVDDLIGLSVTGSTVTVNGTSAAPVWRGVDIAIPDGTTTAGTSYTGDGIRLTTPTDTQSTALTTNYNGFNISSAGALTQDTLGGTINWRGVNLTMPNITQTTGTITADGVRVANGTITTGGTQSIFNAAAAGVGAGTLYGLNIGNITGGAGAETGINIGTGWDIGLQASSGIAVGSQQTLTANSTTPSVAGGSHWLTANTVATLISNFTNGTTGQILAIEVNDVNTDFDCTTSNLNCGSLDITTPTAQDLIYFIYDGTNWNLIEFIDTGSDQSGGADLAEYYVSSESLEVGEVVSIDPSEPLRIRKSGGSDDKNTIGIVSTNPGLVLSGPTDERTYPIALVGRVPVKISQNSLPVLIGDTISASNEPGKAQKATRAGFILGRALEAWSPDSGDDQIEVFVNLTWYDPTIYITGTGNIASTLNQPIPTYEQFFASDSVAFQALLSNLYVKFAENIKTATLEVAALISPSLKTNVISPLGTDLAIQLNDSVDGKDSQLLIQNQDSETVASIDSAGNATFSGELRVNKLVADEITSPTSLTLADVEALLKKAESDQNLLSDAQNWQVETATDSGTLNELALTNLYVTENAATKFLSVTDTLVVGPDLVIASSPTSQNSLNTLASPLELQSGAAQPLHLMAGLVTIDTDGNVVVGGNLTVVGEIASTGLNLHTSSESDNPDLLGIFDDQGEKVGGISASGSAQLTSLTTRTLSIPDDPAATTSATLAGLTLETGASAGKAKVLTGWSEITILQSKVNQNSLIFVTPTSHTSQPLYIKEQTNGSFVVGFDEAVSESVEFNWWIVELAKSL